LDNNQEEYEKFFEWKKYINFDDSAPDHSFICDMCIKLNLERYTGIEKKILTDHNQLMGLKENCKGAIVTKNKDSQIEYKFTNTTPLIQYTFYSDK
jgi:hypothetical protein